MPYRQSAPALASRYLGRTLAIDPVSRLRPWGISLSAAILIPAFDGTLDPRMSMIFFYLLLTCYSVWCLGARNGLLLSSLSTVAGGLAKHLVQPHGGTADMGLALESWNVAGRLMTIGLMAFILAGLRRALELERWRASTDQLTGVLNKGAFEARMAELTAAVGSRRQSLVIAYMDLDGFKQVNDRYGHAAGDKVLRSFAIGATGSLRASDLFARIGGDEFAAVLAVPNRGDARNLAQMLHGRLSAVLAATGFSVTCSMGALIVEDGVALSDEQVLEQADRLMYDAKRAGKNKLEVAIAGRAPDAGTAVDLSSWIETAEAEDVNRARAA